MNWSLKASSFTWLINKTGCESPWDCYSWIPMEQPPILSWWSFYILSYLIETRWWREQSGIFAAIIICCLLQSQWNCFTIDHSDMTRFFIWLSENSAQHICHYHRLARNTNCPLIILHSISAHVVTSNLSAMVMQSEPYCYSRLWPWVLLWCPICKHVDFSVPVTTCITESRTVSTTHLV